MVEPQDIKFIVVQEVEDDLLSVDRFANREDLDKFLADLTDITGVEVYAVSQVIKLKIVVSPITAK